MFNFHDISSFTDLIYDARNNQLIAVLLNKRDSLYTTEFHTINYPPLTIESIRQAGVGSQQSRVKVILPVVLFLLVAGLFLFYKSKKSKRSVQVSDENIEPVTPDHLDKTENPLLKENKYPAILFMGGFQVIDKNGKDISDKFTLKVRYLLAMLLLHSVKHDKGVSSSFIWESLWPDKSENSARNNRNVNLKKIRFLLGELGNFEVKFVRERWIVELDPNVFFDFSFAYSILKKKLYQTETLVQLAKNGRMLPGIEAEWVDGFKSEFSNKLIDGLLAISKSYAKDDPFQIEIADAILLHDQISQNALILKCCCLNFQGKYALAKHTYESYAKEYKLMYGEDYDLSFESIINTGESV